MKKRAVKRIIKRNIAKPKKFNLFEYFPLIRNVFFISLLVLLLVASISFRFAPDKEGVTSDTELAAPPVLGSNECNVDSDCAKKVCYDRYCMEATDGSGVMKCFWFLMDSESSDTDYCDDTHLGETSNPGRCNGEGLCIPKSSP